MTAPPPSATALPARSRLVWLTGAGAALVALTLLAIGPRLGHTFPSLIDDWYAIDRTPGQIGEVLRLGSPEHGRYRPGWIVWNHLQWHTFGGPDDLGAARAWGVIRAAVLPLGVLAALVVSTWGTRPRPRRRVAWTDALAATTAAAIVTVPTFARDVARYGTQEPLLVGLTCLGAASVAVTVRRVVRGGVQPADVLLAVAGVLLWTAGVAQKESAVCLLVLAPFLALELRRGRGRWTTMSRGARRLAVGTTVGLLAPLGVMVVRTIEVGRQEDLVYDARPGEAIRERTVTMVRLMRPTVESAALGWGVSLTALLLVGLALVRRVDWLGTGFLVAAGAFLVFAAQAGVVVSRYYLPVAVLAGLALCRALAALPDAVVGAGIAAIGLVIVVQTPDARAKVERWVEIERTQEALVRETAGLQASGCAVRVTGPDVELAAGIPVLVRYATEERRPCVTDAEYLVIATGTARPTGVDPLVVSCGEDADEVFANGLGRVMRCVAPVTAAGATG